MLMHFGSQLRLQLCFWIHLRCQNPLVLANSWFTILSTIHNHLKTSFLIHLITLSSFSSVIVFYSNVFQYLSRFKHVKCVKHAFNRNIHTFICRLQQGDNGTTNPLLTFGLAWRRTLRHPLGVRMPHVSIKRSSVPNNYDYIMKHRLTLSFTTHFTHDIILSSNIGIHWHSNIKWVNPACLVWKNLRWQPSGIPRNPGRLERRNSIHTADVTKILWVGKAFQHQTQLYTHQELKSMYISADPSLQPEGKAGKGRPWPLPWACQRRCRIYCCWRRLGMQTEAPCV